ncbi:MAG TPA: PAS domain S-box protein [Candidatus Binatia bacterium]|nr:PAS domain S-box protein [Candidatus Binatia bacterium]
MLARRQHPRLMRYSFAALTVCVLAWFEIATWPLFRASPFLPLAVGVVVAATLAGPGPGFFATGLGLIASQLLPRSGATGALAYAPLVAFVGLGAAASLLSLTGHVSRTRMRKILEGVSDGCAFLGTDWRYRFVNRAAGQLAGRPPEELVGRGVSEVFPHVADLPALRELRRAMDEGIPGRLETWYPPHGRWYETNLYPAEEGVMIIVRDVTDRRGAEEALRESERRLRAIFEQSIAGIAQTDLEGRFLQVNERYCEIVGQSRAQLSGRSLSDVIHPDDRSRHAALFGELLGACRDFVAEERYVRPNGAVVWVRKQVSAVRDAEGAPRFCFAIVEEITERKHAESEKDDALQRERVARAEAESANRSKDDFLAVVSHELRTPLTAIVGWLRLLRIGAVDASSSSRALETVERNAGILVRLVEDLLDASRIASGKLKLEVRPTTVSDAVRASLEVVRPAAEAKRIRIVARLSPGADLVLGDPARLQQVVWNLLSNAVKFTPEDGRVEVASGPSNGSIAISVSDSGPGIAPEMLPRIFERFRQAESVQNRRHSGLGLGLAIVRNVVEMHGGTVKAESAGPGSGARFTVFLPPYRGAKTAADGVPGVPARNGAPKRPDATRSVRVPAPPPDRDAPSLAGTRILLVEDEEDTRAVVTRILAWRGAEVRACVSAREARAAFEAAPPDVIVSDIGMPEESGYSLIEGIRRAERGRGLHTPAIALTAYAQETHRLRALASGFDAHVSKPVDPAELVRTVALVQGGAAARG